jgi:archaellum component FlaG (FlaF/FlaG flagellin family)
VDKVISSILLIIAAVVGVGLVLNSALPAISRASGAMSSSSDKVDTRIKTQIEIIHTVGELDENGVWQDTNLDGYFNIFIWVKNVGATRITGEEECDIFLGEEGDFARIPYTGDAGLSYPQWDFQIENDTEWRPGATVKFTVSYSSSLSTGSYFTKVTTPNGIVDEDYFSM